MRAATCFSGIGAPEVAMPHWDWLWHAEIEKFPSAVMAARHSGSVNLGDVTADDFMQRASSYGRLDVLAGGPPCQAFSVAGLRKSMDDDRGNLSLRFVKIAHAIRPRNLLVENVPGWLNTPDNAFGCFLGAILGHDDALLPCALPPIGKSNAGWKWRKAADYWRLVEPDEDGVHRIIKDIGGYESCEVERVTLDARHIPTWPSVGMAAGPLGRLCWATLDAQFFGLAQRRKRVFVVVDFGGGADPVSVLFEPESLCRNPPARGKTGQVAAGTFEAGVGGCRKSKGTVAARMTAFGEYVDDGTASTVKARDYKDATDLIGSVFGVDYENNATLETQPMGPLMAGSKSGGGRPLPAVAYRTSGNCGAWETGDKTDALTKSSDPNSHVIAFSSKDSGNDAGDDIAPTLRAMNHVHSHASGGGQIAVAFSENQQANISESDVVSALNCGGGKPGQSYPAVRVGLGDVWAVRRLTPTECERLQGFPDGFTDVQYRGKKAADGPRYKALGNSWATPVGRWILDRIERFMPHD